MLRLVLLHTAVLQSYYERWSSARGVLPKSISASDVGQTFLSAGSGDFPVPGFRVKLSALVGEVGKLRNRQARKPALQICSNTPRECARKPPPAPSTVASGRFIFRSWRPRQSLKSGPASTGARNPIRGRTSNRVIGSFAGTTRST